MYINWGELPQPGVLVEVSWSAHQLHSKSVTSSAEPSHTPARYSYRTFSALLLITNARGKIDGLSNVTVVRMFKMHVVV